MSGLLRSLGFFILVVTTCVSPSIWAAEVLVPGDLNLDSVTNHEDFFQLLMEYDPSGPKLAPEADANDDLRINHKDVEAAILGRLHGHEGVPVPDPSETGIVTGVVIEDVGDALVMIPITGASVWIASEKGFRLKTTTDEDGTFRFEAVPAGTARVTARHKDYHKAQATVEVVTGEETFVTLRLPPKNVDLTDLSGFVMGASSSDSNLTIPLKGAAVRIAPVDENGITGDFDVSHLPGVEDGHQVTYTNDQGYYVLHDLSPGKYRLTVSANGYTSAEREVEILSSEIEHSEDFVLMPVVRPYGAVAGTVYSYDPRSARPMDAPLAGARVVLKPAVGDETSCSCSRHYEAITDASGQYVIKGVRVGKYIAHAAASLHYPATAEIVVVTQATTLQDFHLEVIIESKGAVAGTVTGVTQGVADPVPLEDALVSLLPQSRDEDDSTAWSDSLVEAVRVRSVTTDAEGKYAFREVAAGEYLVIAWARGWGQVTGAATVVADETAIVDLQIIHPEPPGPASLDGTVFGVTPDSLGLPVPLAGAKVIAIPGLSDWLETSSLLGASNKDNDSVGQVSAPIYKRFVTETDENGYYSFASLPPASYRIIALAEGYESSEQMIELASGVNTQLDFYLQSIPSGPGIVLGTVFTTTSVSGEPVPLAGAKVRMVGVDMTSQIDTGFETETNDEGYFEFAPVPVGEYQLKVSKEGYRSDQQRVEVGPGEMVRLSIELFLDQTGESGALEGHVWEEVDTSLHQTSIPVEGALVFAIPVSFSLPNTSSLMGLIEVDDGNEGIQCTPLVTRTDESGYFRFDSVPSGTVAVVVLAEGFIPALDTTRIAAGETTVLDLYLKPVGGGNPHASLSGIITGHSDDPTFAPVYVDGAKITLIPQETTDPDATVFKNTRRLVTYSNEFGEYEFSHLSAGLYWMKVEADGYVDTELSIDIPKGTAVRQDVELMPEGEEETARLYGYVTAPSSGGVAGPVADATVRLVPDGYPVIELFPPPNVGFDRTTDENGYYLFDSLPANGYQVVVLKEGYIPTLGHIELEPGEERQEDWVLNPIEPEPKTRLFGYVTEGSEDASIPGKPIAGAIIRLFVGGILIDDKNDVTNLKQVTDENGYYEFSDLDPGTYLAVCSKEGYGTEKARVSLDEGDELQHDFLLTPLTQQSATLRGVITEDVGVLTVWIPISGASIVLSPVNTEKPSISTTSGPGGDYMFEDVTPGDYTVSVNAEGYVGEEASVHLSAGADVVKNFALEPVHDEESASLFGRVREMGEDGELTALAGATIFAVSRNVWYDLHTTSTDFEFPPPLNTGYSRISGEDGSYEFDSLPPGTYWVFAWKDGYTKSHALIELAAGDRKEKNWRLSPICETVQAHLFGYVTESLPTGGSKPLANALIRLIPSDVSIPAIFPPPYVGFDRMTDENGYYDFNALPANGFSGIVLLNGYNSEFFSGHLAEGESLQKDFTLQVPIDYAKITVEVTESTPLLRPGRIPIDDATVTLTEANGEIRIGHTNSWGYHTFDSVTPGDYVISVSAEDYASQSRSGTVAPGGEVTESFQLKPAQEEAATLTGYVSQDMGFLDVWIPIQGALVSLAGVNTDEIPRTTQTNAYGKYTFEDVSPREYDVTAQAEGFISETQQVTLQAGEEKYLNFSLQAEEEDTGTLTGYVSQDMGFLDVWVPIEGALVSLAGVNTDEVPRTTTTDEDGKYTFEDVSPREYDVTAQAEGFITETQQVTVKAGEVNYLSFMLDEDVSGFGTVTGKVTAIRPNGEAVPVPGLPLPVRLRSTSTAKNEEEVFERNTLTGPDGTYEFDEIPAGEYQLKVTIYVDAPLRATIKVIAGETTVQDFSYETWHPMATVGK